MPKWQVNFFRTKRGDFEDRILKILTDCSAGACRAQAKILAGLARRLQYIPMVVSASRASPIGAHGCLFDIQIGEAAKIDADALREFEKHAREGAVIDNALREHVLRFWIPARTCKNRLESGRMRKISQELARSRKIRRDIARFEELEKLCG
jgi:hypothetical protein